MDPYPRSRAYRDAEACVIRVEDNGVGFDTSILDLRSPESHHVGLQNVYQRLRLRYGDRVSFSLESEAEKGTAVTITIEEAR